MCVSKLKLPNTDNSNKVDNEAVVILVPKEFFELQTVDECLHELKKILDKKVQIELVFPSIVTNCELIFQF